MASEWIKCISAQDKSMSIYINMALATTASLRKRSSRRASSSGIDMPSGISTVSAESAGENRGPSKPLTPAIGLASLDRIRRMNDTRLKIYRIDQKIGWMFTTILRNLRLKTIDASPTKDVVRFFLIFIELPRVLIESRQIP